MTAKAWWGSEESVATLRVTCGCTRPREGAPRLCDIQHEDRYKTLSPRGEATRGERGMQRANRLPENEADWCVHITARRLAKDPTGCSDDSPP